MLLANQGANGYRDDRRYSRQWTIVANVSRRTHECLQSWVTNAFAATTVLRVYDLYANPFYTDYTSVKLKSVQSRTTDGGQRYTATLIVVK